MILQELSRQLEMKKRENINEFSIFNRKFTPSNSYTKVRDPIRDPVPYILGPTSYKPTTLTVDTYWLWSIPL